MRQIIALCAAALALGATPVMAQTVPGWDPAGLQLTRAELQEMLERFEQTATEAAYSDALRQNAQAEANLIRQRLQEGDLRPGDRVALIVEGFPELSDTFNIGANRSIVLPEIGEVTLAGVLRAELQPHLSTHISRFINNPIVHASSLIRLQIMGAVGIPGFYMVPSDILVGSALMMAGGPSPAAKLEEMTIRRGEQEIWSGARMQEAVMEGRTLDQLSIRAGDTILVPERSSRLELLRNGALIATGLASLIALAVQVGIF